MFANPVNVVQDLRPEPARKTPHSLQYIPAHRDSFGGQQQFDYSMHLIHGKSIDNIKQNRVTLCVSLKTKEYGIKMERFGQVLTAKNNPSQHNDKKVPTSLRTLPKRPFRGMQKISQGLKKDHDRPPRE